MAGGRTGWTVPRFTNARRRTGPPAGKRGMVRAGGSASRTISDSNTPDPGGGHHPAWKRPKGDTHGPRWTPDANGLPVLGSLTPAENDRRNHAVPDRASAVVETKSGSLGAQSKSTPTANAAGRKQRVGATGDVRQGNDATRRSAIRPLSVEVVEFSPVLAPEQNLLSVRKTMSSGTVAVIPTVVAEPPLPTAGGGGAG